MPDLRTGQVPDTAWFAATVSCRAACPVGTDAAGYVQAIADGRLADAYDLARAHNPFPSVCGRVCSAPCEKACRRGVIDAPVAIRALKRVACEAFGVEHASRARWHAAHAPPPPITRPSVGIAGAGPAGLAAAYALRLAGHAVTLYDASDEPGGMLLWGIPAFRLPRELVRSEIAAILDLGITFVGRCRIGAERGMADLLSAHAAVLLAMGCSRGRTLPTRGAALPGVLRALEFLDGFNHGATAGLPAPVIVIGGGSVAFDAARSARRLVAHDDGLVHLVAPERLDALPVPPEELHEAMLEGVVIHAASGVRRIEGTSAVSGVTVAPIASLYDADGRFRPSLVDGRDERLAAGTVILAVGQQSDAGFLDPALGLTVAPWGDVASPARDGRTAHPAIYSAGDVSTGPGDLIDAIASGQRAAASIIADLAPDRPHVQVRADAVVTEPLGLERRYWSGYDTIARRVLPVLPAAARAVGSEVEGTLAFEEARREASRCLLCDTHIVLDASRCIACALCVDVCPYGCIALVADPQTTGAAGGPPDAFALTLDETACIRCGLCVDRCPPHALDLVRV